MVVSDFDGTLYAKQTGIVDQDLVVLSNLAEQGYLRVLATGRSLKSLYRVIDSSFPVDYVVFSSGAGVFNLPEEQLLKRTVFNALQTAEICRRLIELGVNFMVHHPIPDNHYFHYCGSDTQDSDFMQRVELYRDYALKFDWRQVQRLEATQFVLITPGDDSILQRVRHEFEEECSVIWSSSPLDGRSLWIELFPAGAHKGSGIAWLAEQQGIAQRDTMAIGNDYNDLHMLEWSQAAFVVANAPDGLRQRFTPVAACGQGGFSEAVTKWLQQKGAER